MKWVINKLYKWGNQRYSNKKTNSPRLHICNYNPEEVISLDKEIIDIISKDEQMLNLLKELGTNGFDEWFRETFGEPAPIRYTGRHMGRFKTKKIKIKEELIYENEFKEIK